MDIDISKELHLRHFPIFREIEKAGSAGKYALSLAGLARAFELTDRDVRCIDGRTPGGLHLAGAGCLAKKAAEILRAMKAEGIYSHENCGAANKAKVDPQTFAEKIAAEAGIPYKGHLSVNGPHIELVTYVDGTGRFDWSKIPLPNGFTIGWRYTFPVDPVYAVNEVVISAGIALGHHGLYHEREEPFIIVPVGDPYDPNFSAAAIRKVLTEINLQEFDGRVRIDEGFNAPLAH